jgi:surface antigen
MNPTLRCAVAALVVVAASPLAVAAGWGALLHNSPAADYNDEDLRQFLEAAKTALDAPGPPQPVEWSNASTGAGGRFLVLGPAKVKNFEDCKRVRSTANSKKQKGYPSVWTACRDPSGRWGVVSMG